MVIVIYGKQVDMDMKELLKKIEEKAPVALEETYWLCIFAVNEHASICGDCWTCRPRDESSGKMWTGADFRLLKCKGCSKPKFNPCPCGMLKYSKDDPLYEIDKFDDVVKQMDGGLVVSEF